VRACVVYWYDSELFTNKQKTDKQKYREIKNLSEREREKRHIFLVRKITNNMKRRTERQRQTERIK